MGIGGIIARVWMCLGKELSMYWGVSAMYVCVTRVMYVVCMCIFVAGLFVWGLCTYVCAGVCMYTCLCGGIYAYK